MIFFFFPELLFKCAVCYEHTAQGKEVKKGQHRPRALYDNMKKHLASSCCHSGLQANSAAQFLIKDEQAQANVV